MSLEGGNDSARNPRAPGKQAPCLNHLAISNSQSGRDKRWVNNSLSVWEVVTFYILAFLHAILQEQSYFPRGPQEVSLAPFYRCGG